MIFLAIPLSLLPTKGFSQYWEILHYDGTSNFRGAVFFDSSCGLAIRNNDALRTSDGGASWHIVGSVAPWRLFVSLALVDSNVAVIGAAGGDIYRTSDRGQTWVMSHIGSWDLNGFAFRGSLGIAVESRQGFVHRTTDAGLTWSTIIIGTTNGLTGVTLVNDSVGYLVGFYSTVYKTTDGGLSWNATGVALGHFDALSFSDENHGLIAGFNGVLFRTSDGGASWSSIALTSPNTITGLAFSDSVRVTMVGSNIIGTSTDGGLTWKMIDPRVTVTSLEIKSITITPPHTIILAGSGGAIFRRTSFIDPPPIFPASPDDGAIDVALDFDRTSLYSEVRWNPYRYTLLKTRSFRLQASVDSTFPWANVVDYTMYDGNGLSDSAYLHWVEPYTTYFWRVRALLDGDSVGSPWTPTRRFSTGSIVPTTIRQIQEVSLQSLLRADTAQNLNPELHLQTSSYNFRDVLIEGVCAVPASVLGYTTDQWGYNHYAGVFYDSALSGTGQWRGLYSTSHASWNASYSAIFSSLKPGDRVRIIGNITEDPDNSQNSNTVLNVLSISVDGAVPLPPSLPVVSISDFVQGLPSNQLMRYSTGEQYEGAIVEMHNLWVYTPPSVTDGTFIIRDNSGNTMQTSDLSKWHTLRSHRDPGSTYTAPVAGTRIDTLRGLIIADGARYRIAPLYPGDIVYGEPHPGVISGVLFDDLDSNGVFDPEEPEIGGWRVDISGRFLKSILTDSDGHFAFSGLDSGSYNVNIGGGIGWYQTFPAAGYSISLSVGDTSSGKNFGFHYPWNKISGRVFRDRNENGVVDANEEGLSGVTVRNVGANSEAAVTDIDGIYMIRRADVGGNDVTLQIPSGWEQIVPPAYDPTYHIYFIGLGRRTEGFNFGIHPIPTRIKLDLRVQDNIGTAPKILSWGVRPGASYGIWGADPQSTSFDFSEGEAELPPRSFAESIGLFDARFVGPRASSDRFAEGSWIDMRDFTSVVQVDTHQVLFLPGYAYGGNYPMRFTWSKTLVAASYDGEVEIVDPVGRRTDMKTIDTLTIWESSTSSLTLVARLPRIKEDFIFSWRLISPPERLSTLMVPDLFPSSVGVGYSYNPNSGYRTSDSLTPGRGYFIKCRLILDSAWSVGGQRLRDTLAVEEGWNIVGGLSVPIPTASLRSDPPDIRTSPLFGYHKGYFVADSLQPWKAYWINVSQPGVLILDAAAHAVDKELADQKLEMQELSVLVIRDARGSEQKLFVSGKPAVLRSDYFQLPPLPPSGIFDARFASGRLVENFPDGQSNTLPIQLTSPQFPLDLKWNGGRSSMAVSLVVDAKEFPMTPPGELRVEKCQLNSIALRIQHEQPIPSEFHLDQNYPNPFNPTTLITYALPHRSAVSLKIFDVLGRNVSTLVDQMEDAGFKHVNWIPQNLPTGVYFYQLQADGFTSTKKMLLLH